MSLPAGCSGVLCGHWFALRDRHGGMPPRDALDPADVLPVLPRLVLLESRDGGLFRYRLTGTQVDRFFGRPLTGLSPQETPVPELASSWVRLYRAVFDGEWPMQVELPYSGGSAMCRAVIHAAVPLTAPDGGRQILGVLAFRLIAGVSLAAFLSDHGRR